MPLADFDTVNWSGCVYLPNDRRRMGLRRNDISGKTVHRVGRNATEVMTAIRVVFISKRKMFGWTPRLKV